MKKYLLVAGLAVAAVLCYGVGAVLAEDAAAAPESIGVEVDGVNYCVLTTLAADEAADAPAELAKINALKITAVKDIDGKDMPELVGKTLHYVPTASAKELIVGNANATVHVMSRLFKDAACIKVEEFKAEGGSGAGDGFDLLPVGKQSGLQVL